MQDPDLLYDRCQQLLQAVGTWEMSHPEWSLPSIRLVTYGRPAWDCEMVAAWLVVTEGYGGDVAVGGVGPLDPQAERSMRVATLGVSIVRCDPAAAEIDVHPGGGGELPSAAAIELAARVGYADHAHLLNALHSYTALPAKPFGIHQWAPLSWSVDGGEPGGGMTGSTLLLRLGLTVPL